MLGFGAVMQGLDVQVATKLSTCFFLLDCIYLCILVSSSPTHREARARLFCRSDSHLRLWLLGSMSGLDLSVPALLNGVSVATICATPPFHPEVGHKSGGHQMAKAGWAPAEVVDTSVKDGQWKDV